MHRVILKSSGARFNGLVSDHINRNKLDNRRINLRVVTPHESNLNRCKLQKNNRSGFSGVHCDRGRWAAKLDIKGKRIYLGWFKEKMDAVEARKEAERRYYGQG